MKINLKYFSWIRVKLKRGQDTIEVVEKITFKKLKPYLIEKDVIFEEIFEDNSTKFFLNLIEINDENIPLNDGDEIAFLPPVTGG